MILTRTALIVALAALATMLWRHRDLAAAKSELADLRARTEHPAASPIEEAKAKKAGEAPRTGDVPASIAAVPGAAKPLSAESRSFMAALEDAFKNHGQPEMTAAKLSREEQDLLLEEFLRQPWTGDQKLSAGMWILSTGRKRSMLDIMDYSLKVCAQEPGLAEKYLNSEQTKVNSGLTTLLAQPKEFAAWMKKNGELLRKVSPDLHETFEKALEGLQPANFARSLAEAKAPDMAGLVERGLRPIQNPGELSAFVRAVQEAPDGPGRERATQATAAYLGRNLSFTQLKDCVAQAGLKPDMDRQFRAAAVVAHMGSDGAARMEWALEPCRSPEERAGAVSSIVSAWTPKGMNDVGEWIRLQPQGLERDAATAAFARQVIHKEPPTAVDWALTIRDPSARNAALKEIGQQWMKRDPEVARAYLAEKGIAAP